MNSDFLTPVQMNRLNLNLQPIFIGQLFIVEALHHPAYYYQGNEYIQVLGSDEGINPNFISDFAQNYSTEIFVHDEDFDYINSKLKDELTKLTRSLSIGNIKKNAIKQTNYLSMQMENLYKDPFNDETLTSQFQNSKNLSALLIGNKDIHKAVFENIKKSKYHYTHTQPLLSSVLLLSFAQSLNLFNNNELEELFLTSYFKDIGMSFIPREKFEQSHLNEFDKILFAKHVENSMLLLEGRVPFKSNHLNLIKNHHFLNYKIQALVSDQSAPVPTKFLIGVESILLSSIDVLVAMISDRPYREPVTSFEALALLKDVISDEYPQEFRSMVIYIKNFL